MHNGEIKEGELIDVQSGSKYPIRNYVPRFVQDDDYVSSFGFQWMVFSKTQIDKFSGTHASRDRFFQSSYWDPAALNGETILEAGCGSGRFTEVVLNTGANLFAVDMSSAVDACWQNNALHSNLTVIQADLNALPFRKGMFDRIFCYGVLQHTPDPMAGFLGLIHLLKPGGRISIDVYHKDGRIAPWKSKYLWRWLTTRIPKGTLLKAVRWYVPKWLPINAQLRRIPLLGMSLGSVVPCFAHEDKALGRDQLVEWAVLDTFDALSCAHDHPQTLEDVRSWFEHAQLEQIEVGPGANGIVGNATKP
jgi:SAM-dependent methyltransferase